jgi:pilus assembly protein CpaE
VSRQGQAGGEASAKLNSRDAKDVSGLPRRKPAANGNVASVVIMLNGRSAQSQKARVVVLTAGGEFEQSVRTTFGGHGQIDLTVVKASPLDQADVDFADATVVVADLDATQPDDFDALQRLAGRLGGRPPIIVVTQALNEVVARQLLQVRVADFLIKPVAPLDLVRACARVAQQPAGAETKEAQIDTFLPAAGGVGVTTLAIQTALLLRGRHKSGAQTCLVDLDFQHGACADYLDLEPRLDLDEIEPQPERLDRQLLEVMLSHHASGLAVIAARRRPAEMRSFDPYVVTRLLDLVSTRFDHVVIDLPRTWFGWTDNVLIGSNRLFIVTEATVPGLRSAKQLATAISERLGDSVNPQVIVNRFEQRMFGHGLRRSDLKQTLGSTFAGTIPNNYGLVREAIDRGVPLEEVKPRNNVTAELKKMIAPPDAAKPATRRDAPAEKSRGLLWAR